MYTVFIALFCSLAVGLGLALGDVLGYGWSTFCGVLTFGGVNFGLGWQIQKRVKAAMLSVQAVMTEGQKRLQAKTARWQMNPPGSIRAAQLEIERDTKEFVKVALARTEELHRFDRWVPMMTRQIATAQFQLCWMIKDFKRVDALMPKAFFVDPVTVAMRLARMYMLAAPTDEIGKVYAKAVRRLRYNQNVLLAGTWSWILLKRGDVDAAFKALNEALKNSDNPVLKTNCAHLANNRVAHFNNSGLGDQWYALLLEEPKFHQPRQHRSFR